MIQLEMVEKLERLMNQKIFEVCENNSTVLVLFKLTVCEFAREWIYGSCRAERLSNEVIFIQ